MNKYALSERKVSGFIKDGLGNIHIGMNDYKKEYLEIYNYFKNNPKQQLTEKDWEKLSVLSNKKRLWYRVGALMAKSIDKKLGREKLVQLISEPSGNFINIYLASRN